MTNYERWKSYMSGFSSPDNYIDWGWYYLIAASLQRRVWCGPLHSPLYSNNYTILVGEPGIGKGLVIKQVSEFLRFHKIENPKINGTNQGKPEEKAKEILEQEEFKRVEKQHESDIARQNTQ